MNSTDRPPRYNPYAPPGAGEAFDVRAVGIARAPGEAIKWIYAAAASVNAALFLAIRFGGELGLGRSETHVLVTIVDGPLRWGLIIVALSWVYSAWNGIPHEARGDVTPAGAVGRFFVPFYNLAWVFLVNTRLCDAIDGRLVDVGDRRHAPKPIAIVATALHYVPIIMLVTAAKSYAFWVTIAECGLWFTYMLQCDVLRRAVVEAQMRE